MKYFRMTGFERSQHYRDRRPPWIKLHVELLDDFAFTTLPDHAKSHVTLLSLLASKIDNRIPWDIPFLTRKIGATVKIDLQMLADKGFIEVEQDASAPLAERSSASTTLASRKQSARPETETETETEIDSNVASVVAHFLSVHPTRRGSSKDQATVKRALGLGYSVADLCEAIDGNAIDSWHVEKRKHELSYVLRDAEHIDSARAKAVPEDEFDRRKRKYAHLDGYPHMTANGDITAYGDAMTATPL